MSSVGRWYNIRCYKHNGALHRVWDRGLVLENNSDYIVIASKKAKVVEANGRCWFTKEPAVTIFSKKEWWNAICMLKKDGVCYYPGAGPQLRQRQRRRPPEQHPGLPDRRQDGGGGHEPGSAVLHVVHLHRAAHPQVRL